MKVWKWGRKIIDIEIRNKEKYFWIVLQRIVRVVNVT